MITLLLILGAVLFVLGDFIKDAHMEEEKVWIPIGKFMMYVALFIFIALIILSIVQWLSA